MSTTNISRNLEDRFRHSEVIEKTSFPNVTGPRRANVKLVMLISLGRPDRFNSDLL